MNNKKEYEANCAMGTILNTTENLKYWVKEKNYKEIAGVLGSMHRGLSEMHSMLALPDEPKLIQGYTAEQWQEIIDGGYLCEFGMGNGQWLFAGYLAEFDGNGYPVCNPVASDCIALNTLRDCRPAQIKGVMRPIFVEPVEKGNECHFFRSDGKKIACYDGNDNSGFPHRWSSFIEVMREKKATSYIEL